MTSGGQRRSETERRDHEPGEDTSRERRKTMKLNPIRWLLDDRDEKTPVLLAVTPPRTGERTLLGVENLLQSIAVPEPFSLELAGDMDGVTLMARCLDAQVVRGQLSAHYPQARIREVAEEDDPLRLEEGEQAWSITLRADGPEYVPLRTFRDDDLLDPGSDPLIALMGALSALHEGERVVARLMLRSLGPDWSQAHMDKAHKRPGMEPREPAYTYQTKPLQMDGVTMAVLGIGALAALKGYLWVQDGEIWKAALLGAGAALGLAAGGWAWHRWKKARKRVEDPILIGEKVSRIAFDAEIQVTAMLPAETGQERAGELLGTVAAAYRHYDNPAGARLKVSKVRPAARPRHDAPVRPRPVREPQRPGRPRGRLPVAPAGGGRRDAAGGAVRSEGAQPLGQGRQGRRPGGRHHRGGEEGDPLSRRPAAAPPPLRGTHPHGQVHPHAPPGHAQDAGEGGGQGRRRHCRRRSPHRPGGGHPGTRPGGIGRQGAPHRPVRRDPLPRHQPAGHPHLLRPRPHRRLGGARGEGPLGAVGAKDAVHPRTDRQDPPRGQRAGGGGAAVHHPRRAEAPVGRELPQGRAQEGLRPLSPGVVGQGLLLLASPVPRRGPRPGADPPLLLRVLQAGAGHPGPAPLHHRPTEDHPGGRRASRLHVPGDGRQGRGRPGGRVVAEPR